MSETNFGEIIFDNFIESVDGELVKKGLGKKPPPFKNADYKFDKPSVIIELKTLKSEFSLNSPSRTKKIRNLIQKWVDNGKLSEQMIKRKESLPPELAIELLKLFKPPFYDILEQANRQIKGTKKFFNVPNAHGLVIFFNDGFYSLNPPDTIRIIGDILRNLFPAIDGFVYLTLRKRLDIPNDKYRRVVWIPKYRVDNNEELGDFVDWLGQNWFDYLETESGAKFASKIESYDPENRDLYGSKFEK